MGNSGDVGGAPDRAGRCGRSRRVAALRAAGERAEPPPRLERHPARRNFTSGLRPAETRCVLAVVELAEIVRALDRLPPVAVVAIPVDRRADAFVPFPPWFPAECAKLRRIQCVAAIVPRAIFDVADQRSVGLELLDDEPRQLDVLVLLARRDVVDGARL